MGDFNSDGVQDLAVANLGSDTVSVLLGNGDGTFQAPRELFIGFSPIFVAVGKFRGAGMPDDLVVVTFFSTDVFVLLGNGDGTFAILVGLWRQHP